MNQKLTAAQAIAAITPKVPCAYCRALSDMGPAEADVITTARPNVGYRGTVRALALMGYKVRPDGIKAHEENGHTP